MKNQTVTSLALVLGLLVVAACTTGTDVADPTPGADEQARLDRIAVIAHRLVDAAHAQPAKPASALAEDLAAIMHEAESP